MRLRVATMNERLWRILIIIYESEMAEDSVEVNKV